jgi:PKD repeat protein
MVPFSSCGRLVRSSSWAARVRRVLGVPLLASLVLGALNASGAIAAPPANDSFANATDITATLPFSATVDVSETSTEFNEPYYCFYSYQTIWYKLTLATDVWLNARVSHSIYSGGGVHVWRDTGSGISGLNFVSCSSSGPPGATFRAVAGTTYYLQASAPCCYVPGNLQVDVTQVTPPQPVASFYFNPSDPSAFDRIQFYDNSFDPGGVGIQSRAWDFGDGTTERDTTGGSYPTHQYANDGDYAVTLTVTTADGRTGSVTNPLSVRTHDVAITRFKAPESASSGQTRQISVGVRNTRYPETVRVALEVSAPGSYQTFMPVGTLDQFVPVRSSNRTTDFTFNYTFTTSDAKIGKVTFRATAILLGGRDALTADNVAISSPTKVSRLGATEAVNGEFRPDEPTAQLALLGVRPNPVHSGLDLLVRLSLPAEGGSAKLKVLDLAGRVVSQRDLGGLGPGTHEARMTWERRPSPGIYWLRLTQGGKSVSTRVTLQ